MAKQLAHEGLAKTHYLFVALGLWVEIRTTFSPTQWQGSEAVLEDLLKGEEFQDSEIHAGVKSQPTLKGPEGAIHLDSKASIDLDLSLIIDPGYSEHDDSLGLYDALQDSSAPVSGIRLENRPDRFDDFTDCLMKLGFGLVSNFDVLHESVNCL
jgi:hypothetical protein